jgi:hypothetical protein
MHSMGVSPSDIEVYSHSVLYHPGLGPGSVVTKGYTIYHQTNELGK